MFKLIFITLFEVCLCVTASAGLMESLATLSSNISGNTCVDGEASSLNLDEVICENSEIEHEPLPEGLETTAEEFTENSYFVDLAETRKSDFICAIDYIENTSGDSQKFDSFADEISEKLIAYSELNADTVNLMGEVSRLARSNRYMSRRKKSEVGAELEAKREQLDKMMIATAALRSSVPLIHLAPVDKIFQAYSVQLNGPSVQIRNQNRPAAETMNELDRAKFKSELRASLNASIESLQSDVTLLNEGINSKGVEFDRSMRESLAQDLSLLEAYQLKNPNHTTDMNELVCRVDQRYGTGAQTRDNILNFGSIGLTLASFGIGGLIRGTAAVGTSFFNGARVAALSGMMTMRSANTLSAIAVGLDAAAGINEIGRACFGDSLENSVTSGSESCQHPTIEQNNQDNCVLASGLTALGIGLASPAGQKLMGRAIASVTGPPGLPEEIISNSRPYTNTEEIPGGGPGALRLTGMTEGRFIRTQDIDPAQLGYSQSLRPVKQFDDFSSIDDIPTVEANPSNIILASDEHSGSNGIVRLATLADGRTVVIKAIRPYTPPGVDPNSVENLAYIDQKIFEEARGLARADAMGIGPEFHGIYVDEFGRTNVVMDVVTGDFPTEAGQYITSNTFKEFDEMFERINDAGFNGSLNDFQYHITRDGHPRIIDAGSFTDPAKSRGGNDEFLRTQASARVDLLRGAGPELGVPYLEELRSTNPEQWSATMRIMHKYMSDNRARLISEYHDYYHMALERQRRLRPQQ